MKYISRIDELAQVIWSHEDGSDRKKDCMHSIVK